MQLRDLSFAARSSQYAALFHPSRLLRRTLSGVKKKDALFIGGQSLFRLQDGRDLRRVGGLHR